jgi:hypothetical protein
MTAADKQLINLTNETTSLTSPKGMIEFASTLKDVIVKQELYTNIKGKNYVHVEAWQFCGAAMGVIAIVKSTEQVITNNPAEVKYRAEVELRRIENDQLVGSGIAFCSNKEYSKKQFDEYAIASMAQTRATSKAYRIAFGWLMKLASFEATPHEEMDGIYDQTDATPSRNTVAQNAAYMNTKASDTAKEFPDLEREYIENEEPQDKTLARAKVTINEMLENQGYIVAVKKKAFLTRVLGKSTIDTVDDANLVADALENEG